MLRVHHQDIESFYKFKCGDIFYSASDFFIVTCCICASKMHLDQFTSHFQLQHLSLVEECIRLESVETKPKILLSNETSILELNPIVPEVTTNDPLKRNKTPRSDVPDGDTNIFDLQPVAIKAASNDPPKQDKMEQCFEQKSSVLEEMDVNAQKPKEDEYISEQDLMIESNTDQGRPIYNDEESRTLDLKPIVNEISTNDPLTQGDVNSGIDVPCAADKKCSDSDFMSKLNLDPKVAHVSCHTGARPVVYEMRDKHSMHELKELSGTQTHAKPFKCDICDSTFVRNYSLKIHKYIHFNIRNHVCYICGKRFTQSSSLNRHIHTHENAAAIYCNICGKTFQKVGNMRHHKKRSH